MVYPKSGFKRAGSVMMIRASLPGFCKESDMLPIRQMGGDERNEYGTPYMGGDNVKAQVARRKGSDPLKRVMRFALLDRYPL
jgi:hypothetical protein